MCPEPFELVGGRSTLTQMARMEGVPALLGDVPHALTPRVPGLGRRDLLPPSGRIYSGRGCMCEFKSI